MKPGLLNTENQKTHMADRYLRDQAAPAVAAEVGTLTPLTLTEEQNGTLRLQVMTTADGTSLAEWTRKPDGTITRQSSGEASNGLVNGSDQLLWDEACRRVEAMLMAELAKPEAAAEVAPALGHRRTTDTTTARTQSTARRIIADACPEDAEGPRPQMLDQTVKKILEKRFATDVARLGRNGPRIPVLTVAQHNWLTRNREEINSLRLENEKLTTFVISARLSQEQAPQGRLPQGGIAEQAADILEIETEHATLLAEEATRGKLYNASRTAAARAARVIIAMGPDGRDPLMREAVWAAGEEQPRPQTAEPGTTNTQAQRWMMWQKILEVYARHRSPEETAQDLKLLKRTAKQLLRSNYVPRLPDTTLHIWQTLRTELSR